MKYTLSDRAYCKLILHALKHPLRSVCGALIGRCDGDVVQVIDAIPYLHTTVATAPNAEIALEQSCAYAVSGGNALVGLAPTGVTPGCATGRRRLCAAISSRSSYGSVARSYSCSGELAPGWRPTRSLPLLPPPRPRRVSEGSEYT